MLTSLSPHFEGRVIMGGDSNIKPFGKRLHTHFSAQHRLYARIDHVFIPTSEIHTVSHASIHAVPWSDHSLVTHKVAGPPAPTGPHQWQLNKTILINPVHYIMLEKELWQCIHINDTAEISPSSLWGAHKVVMRGILIQLASHLKCEQQMDVENLEKYDTQMQTHARHSG